MQRYRVPLDRVHGRATLGEAVEALRAAGSSLVAGRMLDSQWVERAVWLDTETTGLAGGTGTYVFLVGLGYLEDGHLMVEQHFLADLAAEAHFLRNILATLREFEVLITFNGRRFDWPLLTTRFSMHRLRAPWDDPLHLDLMHPAARLWRRPLGTYRLSALEANVLGVTREADVASYLIPSLYLHYLRSGERDALEPVFPHNRMDVISVVGLLGHLARCLADAGAPPAGPMDWAGLATLRDLRRDLPGAIRAYEVAIRDEGDQRMYRRLVRRLASLYRRSGRPGDAMALWERETARLEVWGPAAYVEVAKICEHLKGDLCAALEASRRALDVALAQKPAANHLARTAPASGSDVDALRHRVARLERRLTTSAG
ncbi:MAG: ribonuclease H-like domain-containing protein [Armatimonadetes bacterium]|nr:ribonuclease H-like domain-containing protein [Armatimonadota bacterium]